MKHTHINFGAGAFFMVLAVLGINCRSYSQGKETDKQIYLAFRYDDYAWNSATSAELKIIEAFRKNRASITFVNRPIASYSNHVVFPAWSISELLFDALRPDPPQQSS